MNALALVHGAIRQHVKTGDVCIDATAGRGNDTALLCELVGRSGKVIAFDIQQEAVESTKRLLLEKNMTADVHNVSHEFMDEYAHEGTVSCIVFNLGYLPGGNHSIFTHFESSKLAIEAGLKLLKKGGLMCVTIYHGGATGYEERDCLLEWLRGLDSQIYQVLVTTFHNWKKDPPIPVFIIKNEDE